MSELLRRVERDAGVPGLTARLQGLAPADLRSLLLEVMRAHAERTPAALLAQYGEMTAPDATDARRLHELEGSAFAAASAFEALDLAPVSPLGLNAVLGRIDQNNVLSTVRNTEVLADPTAALALEAALRRRAGSNPVRLCACARILRLQPFDAPGFTPHFRLFALVTAGRALPDHAFQLAAMREHIAVYQRLLGRDARVEVAGPLGRRLPEFAFDPERDEGYYEGAMLRITATDPSGADVQLADGGLVNWTQRLLANGKERLMTSAIGLGLYAARWRGVVVLIDHVGEGADRLREPRLLAQPGQAGTA